MRPLAIDLCCGLGGWAEGLTAEGWDVVGFDIARVIVEGKGYPAQLVLQDITALHGSQFVEASLIVASPPCQRYSYMAMPWGRSKELRDWYLDPEHRLDRRRELNRLFDTCFRLQDEASAAAGRRIPLVVENVRGAEDWVGKARWNYGSFYLWGDVPALMPSTKAFKSKGVDWNKRGGQDFTRLAGQRTLAGLEGVGVSGSPDERRKLRLGFASSGHWTPAEAGIKQTCDGKESWFYGNYEASARRFNSSSDARKKWSALIAKIPLPLARHIGMVFRP